MGQVTFPGVSRGYADLHYQALDADLTSIAALSPADGTFIRRTASAWVAASIVSGDLTTALTTPPAIGGTTPAAGTFTSLVTTTGSVTVPDGQGLSVAGANGSMAFANNAGAQRILRLLSYSPTFADSVRSAFFQFGDANAVFSGNLGVVQARIGFSATGVIISNLAHSSLPAPTSQLHLLKSDAVTNAVTTVLTLGHNSSSTPASNFGAALAFQLESSTTENQDAGLITVDWSTATHASRASRMTLSVYNVATLVTMIEITPNSINIPGGKAIRSTGALYFDAGSGGSGDLVFRYGASFGTGFTLTNAGVISIAAGRNLEFSTATGTRIGTGATQKLAFWNAAPIVQPAFIADPSGGATTDTQARTAINAILDLLSNTGLMAAS